MQRIMLKSKLHRVRVTDAKVDYEGSVAIDASLMELSNIYPFEKVEVYNITNGNRFQTYAIEAPRGSGVISINGAAAHLAKPGHIVIIASYSVLDEKEARGHKPILVYVDENNIATKISAECAGNL